MSKCLTCQIGHNCLDCHFITLVMHPYLLFNHHNNKIPSSIFPLMRPSYFLFLKTRHITSVGSVLGLVYWSPLVTCLLSAPPGWNWQTECCCEESGAASAAPGWLVRSQLNVTGLVWIEWEINNGEFYIMHAHSFIKEVNGILFIHQTSNKRKTLLNLRLETEDWNEESHNIMSLGQVGKWPATLRLGGCLSVTPDFVEKFSKCKMNGSLLRFYLKSLGLICDVILSKL